MRPVTLDELLERERLTQVDLAQLLGCNSSTISRWVNGSPMSPAAYDALRDLFGFQDHQVAIPVSGRQAAVPLGGGGWENPHDSSWTQQVTGRKRPPETIERQRRAHLYRKTVTVTIEQWDDPDEWADEFD